jgi:hypothetical protein
MTVFDAKNYEWAKCVPEILVDDFKVSLAFYRLLGFVDMYQREGFAYLEYQGAQFMIDERGGNWETGPMEKPYGRGINFQFTTDELDQLIDRLNKAGISLYEGKKEKWRDLGGQMEGSVEFLVQDPDGYLLRFLQTI